MNSDKLDEGKPDWSLMPMDILTEVVKVLTFGKIKYQRDNWQQVSDAKNRYFSALCRHIAAWQGGDKNDEDSGLPHLAHACCCLIFLMWFDKNETQQVDEDIAALQKSFKP